MGGRFAARRRRRRRRVLPRPWRRRRAGQDPGPGVADGPLPRGRPRHRATRPARWPARLAAEVFAVDGWAEVGYDRGRRIRLRTVESRLVADGPGDRAEARRAGGDHRRCARDHGPGRRRAGAGLAADAADGRHHARSRPRPETGDTAGLSGESEIKAALHARLRREGRPAGPAEIEARYQALRRAREVRENLDDPPPGRGGASSTPAPTSATRRPWPPSSTAGAQRFGDPVGLIHGAGLIKDKLIREKTPESFDRVLGTKVDGALNLIRLVRPEALKFTALFSSIAGRFGNVGQSDYAAANEVLNKLARWLDRRWPGRVVSVIWGPWSGVGMVSQLEGHLGRRGLGMIAPRSAAPSWWTSCDSAARGTSRSSTPAASGRSRSRCRSSRRDGCGGGPMSRGRPLEVAIVGMGCRFPGRRTCSPTGRTSWPAGSSAARSRPLRPMPPPRRLADAGLTPADLDGRRVKVVGAGDIDPLAVARAGGAGAGRAGGRPGRRGRGSIEAAVVLKRRADAERDGDRIYAVVQEILDAGAPMIGRAMSATGMAGVIEAALALYHRALPPTPAERPDGSPPLVDGPTVDPPRPGRATPDQHLPRIVMEDHAASADAEPGNPGAMVRWETEAILLSAPDRAGLADRARELIARLEHHPRAALKDIAYTLNCADDHAAGASAAGPGRILTRRPRRNGSTPCCPAWTIPRAARSATAAAPISGTSRSADRGSWRSCSPARARSTRGCSPTSASTSPRSASSSTRRTASPCELGDAVPPSEHVFGRRGRIRGRGRPLVGADGGERRPQRAMGALPGADAPGPAPGRRGRPQQRRDPGAGGRGRAADGSGAGAAARPAGGDLPRPGIGRRHAGGAADRRRRRPASRRGGLPGGRCRRGRHRHRQLPAPGRPGRAAGGGRAGGRPPARAEHPAGSPAVRPAPITRRASPRCSGRSPTRSPA